MTDLGTLGDPDASIASGCVNQRLAVGGSLTSSIPDPNVGFPPMRPSAWVSGKMIDLGTLGGDFGSAQCGNNRGQVIGVSSLPQIPLLVLQENLVAVALAIRLCISSGETSSTCVLIVHL